MRLIILIIIFLFTSANIWSADPNNAFRVSDSIRSDSAVRMERMTTQAPITRKQRIREFSYAPLPLIVSSFIVKARKEDFRGARNNFMPGYTSSWDNYIQYSPIALTLALKVAGVEGRNKWPGFILSSAFSYAAMAGFVNLGKHTINERRPDGSSNNSFPSGHTATAFASATILHKEYGLTRSMWYSIAGYSLATFTGVMRVMNNRHWVSDILCGAGIGIFSVDLGYFLSDLILKDKCTIRQNREDTGDFYTSPNFFSVNIGAGLREHDIDIDGVDVNISRMVCAQAEMAYFITPHLGAGARFSVSSPIVSHANHSDNMGIYTFTGGVYLQFPLASRFAIGGKVMAGRLLVSGCKLGDNLNMDKKGGFTYGFGANIAYAYRNNVAWRLNMDYDINHMNIRYTHNNQHKSEHKTLGNLMLTASASLMF